MTRWPWVTAAALTLGAGIGAAQAPQIREWPVPWAQTFTRDPYVAPDGRVFFCGMNGNYVGVLDTVSGAFRRFELPSPANPHNLIIDAKVSLNAYTRYINAEDDAERRLALNEHVTAIGQRIKELSNRHYFELPGLNAPEMVFMFVPIESAFVEKPPVGIVANACASAS